ncbi:hypothetical protein L6452_09801 [Arctium lappa]|uniref:Uncharacterized protein n=1 Tax=Arctium lappa TaxID=4217 RepID=A0ACB9DLD8_ARCLA|nr:hypothetical protein L6452_09801 [Arctium lappa]
MKALNRRSQASIATLNRSSQLQLSIAGLQFFFAADFDSCCVGLGAEAGRHPCPNSTTLQAKLITSTKQYYHEVLGGMMEFAREVVGPTSFDGTTNTSERFRHLKEIFPGAIGALDGTLIHVVVPSDQQARYRGRGRGECYQNVLAIYDFNMIFTFVWAGWEGIAHDSRVLREVAFNPTSGFPFPSSNKYYLCDAAYTCTRGFMTPYRNTSTSPTSPEILVRLLPLRWYSGTPASPLTMTNEGGTDFSSNDLSDDASDDDVEVTNSMSDYGTKDCFLDVLGNAAF